jgi:predicted RNase H-like nuclease (RuvC/YqgF family)
MKIRVNVIALGCALVCLAAATCYGQEKSNTSDTSLGDIARQLKAQKAKETKPPTKVITTETIAQTGDAASGSKVGAKGKSSPQSTTEESGTKKAAHDEAYYRSKMSTLQSNLDTHRRELDVLQQKLGQNQNQYYADPNKSLLQQYSREDIDKLTAEIDAKKQEIADDEKAMDDLRDQLRHEGGDPGWLR